MMDTETIDFLAQPEQALFLNECLAIVENRIKLVEEIKKYFPPEMTSDVVSLLQLRVGGSNKFSNSLKMFFTRDLLEQATSEAVSRYKGKYFNEKNCTDLCCGMGGSTIGLAANSPHVTACDINPVHLKMAEYNLKIYGLETTCTFLACDITEKIPETSAYHFDPSRRTPAGREYLPENYQPPLSTVDMIRKHSPDVMVKVSPLYPIRNREDEFSIDVISLHGEVKEILLCYGTFNTHSTRAIMLPEEIVISDNTSPEQKVADTIEDYIFEPDHALVKAGLVANAAEKFGLSFLNSLTRYLTGTENISSPLFKTFKVEETMPFSYKKLNRYLKSKNIGNVAVKCKDSSIKASSITKKLKLKGNNTKTLFYLEKENEEKMFVIGTKI